MASMPKRPKTEVAPSKLLERITGDTESDDEALWALAETVAGEVTTPTDAFVVGEPVQITAIDYDGNPRAGLLATCRRGDERHVVSFGDVVFSPGTEGARFSAVYRTWLGLAPHDASPGNPTRPQKRHKAEVADVDLSQPINLVVLALKSNAIRCRVLGTEREITLRTAVRWDVPGEIITVIPTKQWTHAGHPYLSGKVQSSRLDVQALELVPLGLKPEGDWDPEEEYWGEEGEPLEAWAKPIVARGKRPAFEMEQVIPGEDPKEWETDPIIEASELKAGGDRGAAEELLMKTLAEDLRCLDAHAHLGNFQFEHLPKQAMRHYMVGASIGALTLGLDFDGVLPWGHVDNRPFLRCLHGIGLCFWRFGDLKEAARTFTRMLWLNPSDNQGARFNLADVEAGRTWEECEGGKRGGTDS
ncbi:MAG: cytoplasmic protein [Deltaproteobacteria bacterium]|nr:cytoplasmic protein [Deltaproteobacteria bacterium]